MSPTSGWPARWRRWSRATCSNTAWAKVELLNVNTPAKAAADPVEIDLTRMGKRVYQDKLLERLDPRGTPLLLRSAAPPPTGVAEPGTDFHAVSTGKVAITPIHLDLTAKRLLKRLHGWEWRLEAGPEASRVAASLRPWPERCQRWSLRSASTALAAFRPGSPVTPPPGCAPAAAR